MLKDRKVLVEKEIESLKKECAQLYMGIILGAPIPDCYDAKRDALVAMMTDLSLIDMMIANGQE